MSLPQLSHASNDPVTAGRKLNLISVLVCLKDLLWTVKGGGEYLSVPQVSAVKLILILRKSLIYKFHTEVLFDGVTLQRH